MKKSYILILAVLISFGGSGCEKKAGNATMDSTASPAQKTVLTTPAGGPKKAANPNTTTIMPPGAGTGVPIQVTLPGGGNSVDFYVFFIVNPASGVTQTVNVGPNGPYTSGARSGSAMTAPLEFSAPATVNVTASLSTGTYSASSIPVNSNVPQTDGWDVTTYDDGNGNKAIIAIMDIGE